MRAADVRRWLDNQRVAEARRLHLDGPIPDPEASWRQASSLLALLGRMIGWPVAPDSVRTREDAAAAQAWARVRAAFRRRT